MSDALVPVAGAAGTAIELPLPRGPATGHEWHLVLPPGVEQVADSPGRPGGQLGDAAGGRVQVRACPGQYRISARLARRWTPDQPVRRVEIVLTVK